MSYDVKCEELAKKFLEDQERKFTQGDLVDLAQAIQDTIERFLERWTIAEIVKARK